MTHDADTGAGASGALPKKAVRLVALPRAAMLALLDGDLEAASARAGVTLPGFFATDDCLWLWQIRADQIAADPGSADWVVRAAIAEPEGVVVGHAGFHGPPDETGLVEVAYTVLPEHRRQGYATAMLRALLERAAAEPSVTTVRASISPDNAGSLGTIAGFGFTEVGEQWDDEDGRELLFEVRAR